MVRLSIPLVVKRSRVSALRADVRGTELRDLVRLTRFYAGADCDEQDEHAGDALRLI